MKTGKHFMSARGWRPVFAGPLRQEESMSFAQVRWSARLSALALALVCAAGGLLSPSRAAQKSDALEAPKPGQKRTDDGTTIHFTYYKSNLGKEAPVIILLHQKDGNRLLWQARGGFADALQKEGYAVITVDLREHGESKVG